MNCLKISEFLRIPVVFFTLILALSAAGVMAEDTENTTADSSSLNPYRHLDWISPKELAAMPKSERPVHTGVCEGIYLSPQSPQPNQSDSNNAPIEASAYEFDTLPDGTHILTGNVILKQGNRELFSDEIRLNRLTRNSTLNGKVTIRQPGMLIHAESANVYLDDKNINAVNTEYVLHDMHAHGTAGRIYSSKENILILDKSSFTTCEPIDNAWSIHANRIRLNDKTGWGDVYGATIEIKDVPVIYLPWWKFPIDDRRQSGFLFPAIGSGENGLDFSTPYYWNLSPNMDATFTPRYLADRGEMLDSEFRYLSSHTSGVMSMGYLPDDKITDDSRNLLDWRHRGRYGRWVNGVDYTRVSDSNYFLDLDTSLDESSQTHLLQRTYLGYGGGNWSVQGLLQQFQTIDELITDDFLPYRMLPKLTANRSFNDRDSRWNANIGAEYIYFEHPEDITSGPTNAERVRILPSTSYRFRRPWGYIQPKLSLIQRYYDMNQFGLDDNEISLSNPIFSIDSRLFLDRPFQLGGGDYLQTLEPRLFYLYSPYQDQNHLPIFDTAKTSFGFEQLFRDNRFTGGDRVGDANQLSIGLTSRLIDQESGLERFQLSLGQIFYFWDRRVQLLDTEPPETTTLSPFVGRLSGLLNERWSWRAEAQWDSQENNIDSVVTGIGYRDQSGNLINLNYNQYDNGAVTADSQFENIKQTDFSFIWSLTQRWAVIGRWGFDMEQQRSFDNILGLEYESCCWRARLVNRRYLKESNDQDQVIQPTQGIYLQFELKGLGGVGGSIDTLLEESISGYSQRERDRLTRF